MGSPTLCKPLFITSFGAVYGMAKKPRIHAPCVVIEGIYHAGVSLW